MTARENDPLLDKLFKCTVCTVYNQCIVSMLTYTTCDGENVTWQEEEVARGNYVPYKNHQAGSQCFCQLVVEAR
jgi:hypothetical protein